MKWRFGVVFVALASIALIATTFADWYLVTADGRGFFQHEGTLYRAAFSPWDQDRPRAIALTLAAFACTAAAVLGNLEKISDRTATLIISGCALTAVGALIARLAGSNTSEVITLTVHLHYLPGFFAAAGCAAALLVGAAVHLVKATSSS